MPLALDTFAAWCAARIRPTANRPSGRRTLTASERISELIGPDAAVITWDQAAPEIKTFIAMKKGGSIATQGRVHTNRAPVLRLTWQ